MAKLLVRQVSTAEDIHRGLASQNPKLLGVCMAQDAVYKLQLGLCWLKGVTHRGCGGSCGRDTVMLLVLHGSLRVAGPLFGCVQ